MAYLFNMLLWLLAIDAAASVVMWWVSPEFREQVNHLGNSLRELFRRFDDF